MLDGVSNQHAFNIVDGINRYDINRHDLENEKYSIDLNKKAASMFNLNSTDIQLHYCRANQK